MSVSRKIRRVKASLAAKLGRGTIETVLAKDDKDLVLEALQRMMDERGR